MNRKKHKRKIRRKTKNLSSNKNVKNEKRNDLFKKEIFVFIKQQDYFKQFSKNEQETYLRRINNEFDFSRIHLKVKDKFIRLFSQDYFFDEKLIRYKSAEFRSTETFFIFIPILVLWISLYLFKHFDLIKYTKLFNVSISPVASIIAITGVFLAGIDILVKKEKLISLDHKLASFIANYMTNWINSNKVSFIIHNRHTTDFLDWVYNPIWQIWLFLYSLGLIEAWLC